jgi:CubicO group peptidase (beta-lactamase class C family)
MRRLGILAITTAWLRGLPLATRPTVAAPAADIDALDTFIAKALVAYRVPGAAVAVIHDGHIVLLKGYGVRDVTKPDVVDEHTIFQLASLSKAFTGAAAAAVVDAGKLDWDTPITTYLPEFVGYDPYMTRWLTTRDLLAHRTGWREFAGDQLDSFGYSRAEILHRLRYFKPAYSLREVAQYSNPGIFVAAEVAARAAGGTWNDLVEQRLFAPLKMTRSGTSVNDLSDPNASANHALIDGQTVLVAATNQDTMGAAGSVTSTAADMANWMAMLLNEGTFGDRPVLTPQSVTELFKRSMVAAPSFADLPPINESTTGFYFGLGVDSFDYAGHHIVEKAGALSGVRTIMTLLPDRQSGIVVLANLNLTAFPEAVRAFYIHQLLGMDTRINQQEIVAINQQLQDLLKPPARPEHPGPFAWPLSALPGTYENDYYGRATISLVGDTLSVAFGPANYAGSLTHWENGQFMLLFPGATQAYDGITFSIGAGGTADGFTSATYGLFTRVRPATDQA